jgi:Zn-dependent protease
MVIVHRPRDVMNPTTQDTRRLPAGSTLHSTGFFACLIGLLFIGSEFSLTSRDLAGLIIVLMFVVILFYIADKYWVPRNKTFDPESIPWSRINHIAVKRSTLGNRYMVMYFKDSSSPEGIDIEHLNKKELISLLRKKADQKEISLNIVPGAWSKEDEIKDECRRGLFDNIKAGYAQQRQIYEQQRQIYEQQRQEGEPPEITLSNRQKISIQIGLAIAFLVWIYFYFELHFAAAIFIVIILHETGHFIALKLFNLPVHGLFFIPFVGAGVAPKDPFPSPEIEAAVALAGPAFGLPVSVIIILCNNMFGINFSFQIFLVSPLLAEIILHLPLVNAALNLLNLAPVPPLDGGRALKCAFLRGKKSLIPLCLITIGLGGLAIIFTRSIIMVLITGAGLLLLGVDYKRLKDKEIQPPLLWKSGVILLAWAGLVGAYIVLIFLS